jgi:hypothetical protein
MTSTRWRKRWTRQPAPPPSSLPGWWPLSRRPPNRQGPPSRKTRDRPTCRTVGRCHTFATTAGCAPGCGVLPPLHAESTAQAYLHHHDRLSSVMALRAARRCSRARPNAETASTRSPRLVCPTRWNCQIGCGIWLSAPGSGASYVCDFRQPRRRSRRAVIVVENCRDLLTTWPR